MSVYIHHKYEQTMYQIDLLDHPFIFKIDRRKEVSPIVIKAKEVLETRQRESKDLDLSQE